MTAQDYWVASIFILLALAALITGYAVAISREER